MDCAAGLVNILLAIFNILFFLVGVGFVALGIVCVVNIDDVVKAIPDESLLNFAPISIIVIGAIILVISFFGCCGAIQKNTCMLKTYACFLLVILIIQVAIGIYALVKIQNEADFREIIHKALKKSYEKYEHETREFIDAMQVTFECCGLNNANEFPQIPKSCYPPDSQKPYGDGCSNKVSKFLIDSIQAIGIVTLVLGITEVLASVFAICVSSAINKERVHY